MIEQIRKVGNGSALLLDKAIMELIGLEEHGQVQLTVRDGSLIVTPVNPQPVDEKRFQEALDRVMAERSEVLRRLAQ
ncbi:MAG TPA: hypothetical protein VM695_09210 [Phycisphaerae bacterium]|nr:hypothetical protein [Phycisphaerae bacterium]